MLFNSLTFIGFFILVVLLFYWLPQKYRWALLLIASSVFYGAFIPEYLLILFAIILVDYYAARMIVKVQGTRRKRFLWLSITATCLLLVMFKYFNFASENIHHLASLLGWNYDPVLLKWALPIGLSFHTFQSLSYVIEVYRGKQEPEKHLGIYATYVMFFPQLVAGPIERPQNLLHQFREKHPLLYSNFANGFRLVLWGYFKKMVIADNLALYVDTVYENPGAYTGNMLVLATIFFAIQIYCDFSGYSDIAIGTARILGFRLMKNFRQPYFAVSIPDFWRRWHISLSTWFRDYVYIPLGGNQVGRWRWYYNLFIVFLLSGIWHGAGWTFMIWGLLHWVYFVLFSAINTKSQSSPVKFFSGVLTFLLVCFAWIFFRAQDVDTAVEVIKGLSFMPATFMTDLKLLYEEVAAQYNYSIELMYLNFSLVIFLLIEICLHKNYMVTFNGMAKPVRWVSYYALLIWILFFGVYKVVPHFIYFQF